MEMDQGVAGREGREPRESGCPGSQGRVLPQEQELGIAHHQGNTDQTTVSYHLTPVRRTHQKEHKIVNVGEDMGKREPYYIVGGNVNWCSCCGEQCGGSSKT